MKPGYYLQDKISRKGNILQQELLQPAEPYPRFRDALAARDKIKGAWPDVYVSDGKINRELVILRVYETERRERDGEGEYQGQRVLSVDKACETVGVSVRTMKNWIRKKRVISVKTAGGHLRIVEASLWRTEE